MTYIQHYASPLGDMTLASDGTFLTGAWFANQKYFGQSLSPDSMPKALPILQQTAAWLDVYFQGTAPDFTPPMSLKGTAFRMAVWEILQTIPFGQTITYGEIAAKIAQQKGAAAMSAQAVGNAVGHNPIAILIPCHRVVGAKGDLVGYAGGLERKFQLLRLEGSRFIHLPKSGNKA